MTRRGYRIGPGRDLGDLGFSLPEDPPDWVVDPIKQALARPQVHNWLRQQGQQAGDAAWNAIVPRLAARFRQASGIEPAPKPSPWIEKVVLPVLDPFAAGAIDRLKFRARPLLIGAAIGGVALIGIVFVGGYYVGRRRSRRSSA